MIREINFLQSSYCHLLFFLNQIWSNFAVAQVLPHQVFPAGAADPLKVEENFVHLFVCLSIHPAVPFPRAKAFRARGQDSML